MVTRTEVEQAIRNADAAGDSASVRKLGAYLKTLPVDGTDARVMRAAEQLEADKKTYDPTVGMNAGERFLAGAGKAFADIGRGVGQLVGAVSREEVDESKRLDAPLMNTPAGMAGNVTGNVAAAVPTVAIPGAASMLGAAAVGAGMGAVQPVGTEDSRLQNIALGGGAGAAGVAATRGAAAAWKGGKALAEPFTQGGRQRIAGRTLERFGVTAQDVAGASGQPTITGARPTLAETIQRPEGAAAAARLQDAVRSADPDAAIAMTAREVENNAARVGTLRDLAGEGGARDFAEAMRNGTAKQLYGDAFSTKMDFSQLSRAEKGEITKLLKLPALQKAMNDAKEIAANSGLNIAKPEGSIEGLHLMKLALDDAANAAGSTAAEVNRANSIRMARDRLVTFIERMSPAYGEARATYAGMSKPLNQMDVAGEVLKRGTSATGDLAGNPRLMPDALGRAVKDEGRLIKQATGRDVATDLASLLEPDQLAKLRAVVDETSRVAAVGRAGNGPGSATAQRLSSQNLLRQLLGPTGMPETWSESTLAQTLLRPIQFGYQAAEPRIQQTLAELILDPSRAQAALAAAAPAQRGQLAAVLNDPALQQAARVVLPALTLSSQR